MTFWRGGGPRVLPEPGPVRDAGGIESVPQATRQIVTDHLRDVTGQGEIGDDDHLARDLGLDSLARAELLVWLEGEFGFGQGDSDTMLTVGEVMLAACGETIISHVEEIRSTIFCSSEFQKGFQSSLSTLILYACPKLIILNSMR